MSLPDGLRLRAAGADDLPHIAELRHAVGWAVHEWALRAVLDQPHALCVVVADRGGRVVGVGSGIGYGRLGVVGNMIVDPSHRRRGIGAAILTAVVDFLERRGCTRLELSATDDGRPLYAQHGFSPCDPGVSAVVTRDAKLDVEGGGMLEEAGSASLTELIAYDAPRFGGGRGPLLATMLAHPERPLLIVRNAGAITGWAWIRPEAGRIGPVVADEPDAAVALVGEGLARIPRAEGLRLNLPAANRAGIERLRSIGAALEPWTGRMARGAQVPRREDTIYANAVGALG
jgi:GNAT superfamily N-acetyltransferase